MRYPKILALLPVLLLWAAPALSQAAVDVSFSVSVAPPELPVYEQPPLPEPGYIWTPGYWAWDGMDYYWVPGTWVEPPSSDMLWTPGYWGWRDGFYGWNPGYWGPEVGYYGGVNYGFGYTGVGYQGGYWHGGAFFYNRSVANFGQVHIVNVYNAPIEVHERSRVSFNGGQGGLRWRPNAAEQHAMTERHREPTPVQHQHQERAASLPAMHVSQNGGRPQILTTQRPADFARPEVGTHNHQQPGPVGRENGPQPQQQSRQEQPRQEQPRQEPQPRVAGPGPAMRASGAGPEVHTPDRQDAPRPDFRGGPTGGTPQNHGGPPVGRAPDRQEAPRPELRGGPPGGIPQTHGEPPHEQGGAPHQQGPRPEGSHEQGRRAPEPKHEPEPKHDR